MSLMENKGKSSELTNSVFLLDLSSSPVDFASQADLHISDHLQSPGLFAWTAAVVGGLLFPLLSTPVYSPKCAGVKETEVKLCSFST